MGFEYWPWWIGGLALAGLTITFRLATSKTLGVSGSWTQVISWRQQREKAKTEAALSQNSGAAASAMMAAALAEFGEDALDDAMTKSASEASSKPAPKAAVSAPWTAHLVFLLCLFLGGMLWAMYTGNFQIQMQLSDLHTQLAGTGWKMFFVLFVGGLFVGIGTQMAGGCSSGHGLSGIANMSRASMISTAIFFGTAVLVSSSFRMFLS